MNIVILLLFLLICKGWSDYLVLVCFEYCMMMVSEFVIKASLTQMVFFWIIIYKSKLYIKRCKLFVLMSVGKH